MDADPPIAVVIATLDRPRALADTLADVLGQVTPGDEIVVVDQSTVPSPPPDPRVVVIQRAERSLPAARNAGIAATSAPIVVFLDDDVRLHPGCLDAHRKAYVDPIVGGVAGRIVERRLHPNARGLTNRVDGGGRIRTRLDGTAPGWVDTAKGANMSFRRRALAEAGPFDPGYVGTALLEDADLSTRVVEARWRIRFVPEASLDHLHLPAGGVRSAEGSALGHRFHNVARYMAIHRGRRALPRTLATQGAIAVLHALGARDLRSLLHFGGAFAAGWSGGRRSVTPR